MPPLSFISVLSIPSPRLLMEMLNRTDRLPPPQASASLLQGIFSLQRGGGTSTTDFCGSCDISQCGQWATRAQTQILNTLFSPLQTSPLFHISSNQPWITPQRKERKNKSSRDCPAASKMCILWEMNVYLSIYVNQLAINIPRAQKSLTQITKDMPQIMED